MTVRRTLIILAILTLALPLATFNFRTNQLLGSGAARNWQFYRVQRGTVNVAVTAIGTIEADDDAALSFTEAGRVVEVLVQPGDYVLAGDVLAQQANDDQRIAYEQAALSLQLAELQKQVLLEPPDALDIQAAEANIASAQAQYNSIANGVSADEIHAAELRLEQAQQAETDARKIRIEADGDYPDAYYQRLDAQIGAAGLNVEIARLQLEALRNPDISGQLGVAGARIIQAQAELERLKAGATQAELDRADNAIQQAQIRVDDAELALSRTELTAPFAGVVATVNVEAGTLVTPGLPVVELVDTAALHLTVQVDEVDIRQVRETMPARVELDALPNVSLPAHLEQIALVGQNEDGIISYDVRLALPNPDPRVRVGMTADASVIVEERQDVLVVPNIYIRLDGEQAFVNLLHDDGTFEEVEITLGLRGQDESEVVSGIKAGDVLVLDLADSALEFFGG